MRDVFHVWSVSNILMWRVAPCGWIVTQQVLLVVDCWRTSAKTVETGVTPSLTGATTALSSNESCLGRKQDKRSRKARFLSPTTFLATRVRMPKHNTDHLDVAGVLRTVKK